MCVRVWGHCVAFRDLDNKWVALPMAVSFCTFPSCYRSLLPVFVKVQAHKLLQLKGHETKLQNDNSSLFCSPFLIEYGTDQNVHACIGVFVYEFCVWGNTRVYVTYDKHGEQPKLSSVLLHRCFKKRHSLLLRWEGRMDVYLPYIRHRPGGLGHTAGPYPYPQPDYS